MSRKNPLAIISTLLVVILVIATLHVNPAKAEGDDFPVTVELAGIIQSISSTQLVLDSNIGIKIVPATKLASGLEVGTKVVVVAEMDDEQYVAESIQVAAGSSPTSSDEGNNGKGNKGNGKGHNGKGSSDNNQGGKDNNGQGKGHNGNDDQNGKGNNGKGQGNNGHGKGKGNDKDKSDADKKKTECLARTDHPVATQLANSFNVSYSVIMRWHCDGVGFGEIARAYIIAKNSKLTVDQIFALRKKHIGWGLIIKAAGLKAKDIGGLGRLKAKADKTDD